PDVRPVRAHLVVRTVTAEVARPRPRHARLAVGVPADQLGLRRAGYHGGAVRGERGRPRAHGRAARLVLRDDRELVPGPRVEALQLLRRTGDRPGTRGRPVTEDTQLVLLHRRTVGHRC